MKRILYLMHVPWRWVRQRPHYLAERLAETYGVEVFYRKMYFIGEQLTDGHPQELPVHELFVVPPERFQAVWRLNCRLFSWQLLKAVDRFDAAWITHPLMFEMAKKVLPPGMKVVYDCMDDALEFPRVKADPRLRERLAVTERELIGRSDLVFASSPTLKERLAARYGRTDKVTVLPNAMHPELRETPPGEAVVAALRGGRKRFTYIGTISEWFDFPLVLAMLDAFPEVTLFLFGPAEVPIPGHERLLHLGPVPHGTIYRIMELSDLLIMPFRVNELVLGVDPVKLYEYIFSGKPVLAVDYPETAKYRRFVHLYRDTADFLTLAGEAAAGRLEPKASRDECVAFAGNNTWEERGRQAAAELAALFASGGAA